MTNTKPESTTVYLGNTRTITNEYLHEYCSNYGLITKCSRCLLSSEQNHLVDFTFVRFLNIQSTKKFLSISSHTLNNGISLDVRSFNDIHHLAVPLHVDKKICIENLPSNISLNDIKKYLRTFGTIKQINSEINEDQQRNIYIEFESSAMRNKLLKGKIRFHRIRDHTLKILPLLRPTDVDLNQMENDIEENNSDILIHFEREYNIKIRENFDRIDNEISKLIEEKRQNYKNIQKLFQ